MKLAACAYALDQVKDFAQWAAKQRDFVSRGAAGGADLLVFPEYALMELAGFGGPEVASSDRAALEAAMGQRAAADAVFARLAAEFSVHILGGSGPYPGPQGAVVNRATLFGPGGVIGHQDKQIMTRFEREDWGVAPGDGLQVFTTPFGRIGVVICYDSEFPLLARALCEAGAEILLVPACTETLAGHSRVRVGAMARALENQCVVVHAPLVGEAPWCAGVEVNTGVAAIYGPADIGWPETGVIAEGSRDIPGWVMAEVPRERIAQTRADGGVLLFRHWEEQAERLRPGVQSRGI